MDEKKDQELEKTLNGTKRGEYQTLTQTIIDLHEAVETDKTEGRLGLVLLLSMMMWIPLI